MAEKKYVEKEAMLEYIDQNIPRMIPDKDGKHPIPIEVVRNFIAIFDTADVVPVVRCKDCKFYEEAHYEDEGETPRIKHVCRLLTRTMQIDDYCSYGEKVRE